MSVLLSLSPLLALWPNALIYLPYNISLPLFWGYKLFERRSNDIDAWPICLSTCSIFQPRDGCLLLPERWGDQLQSPELNLSWGLGFPIQHGRGCPSIPMLASWSSCPTVFAALINTLHNF